MNKKEISGGWFAISVGLLTLIEENLTPEEIKEKLNRITDYLYSDIRKDDESGH